MQAKYKIPFWASIATFAVASVVWWPAAEKKRSPQDNVAVVNGSKITRADFDREMRLAYGDLSRRGQAPTDSQLSRLGETVLDRLITRELLYQESGNKGIEVGEAEIDEQLMMLKKRFASEEQFKNMLSQISLSEADVKFQMGRALAIQKLIEAKFVQEVTVSDEEMKAYYDSHPDLFKQPEQVLASHILVSIDSEKSESYKAEARKKIKSIQQMLRKSQDFSALAKEFSQCPSSDRGGDLGYFQRGQMVKPFQEAAFALKSGEISDIVETRFGYHLIKIMDKKPETTISYDDAKDTIDQSLKNEKVQKEVSLYVAELKKEAKVERFLSEGGN